MTGYRKLNVALLFVLIMLPLAAGAQVSRWKAEMAAKMDSVAKQYCEIHPVRVERIRIGDNTITVTANKNCSYIPLREGVVADLYESVRSVLPAKYRGYSIRIISDGKEIRELIPHTMRSQKKPYRTFKPASSAVVTNLSTPVKPDMGLAGRNIALWQSHGLYFNQSQGRWVWQRARLMQTVEDLFTQGYVLPYLVPMLERAGAGVFLPRERDCGSVEIIVDDDENCPDYSQRQGIRTWQKAGVSGFAHRRATYEDGQNPFSEGACHLVRTIPEGGRPSVARWSLRVPSDGDYSVYVAYVSLPESSTDARYTVSHAGGMTSFSVNQRMGGGTWIYLGRFHFLKQGDNFVELSNVSSQEGRVVVADAVKCGGGMGNIVRRPKGAATAEGCTSGRPRFCEGARYWLQWAGMPRSVYSETGGGDDYKDDLKSRALWVNYLSGGSTANPDARGLGVPLCMALALHSDAGTTPKDSIIGTLAIFGTKEDRGRLSNGSSRYLSRDLADMVQSSIVDDVRRIWEPEWSRRGLWNKGYYEARIPKIPTVLIEMLSHQNFHDMRYGLDPRFHFDLSRAVYKGVLRFVSEQYGCDYKVQPLPVTHFDINLHEDMATLSWHPETDPLEPSAVPDKFVVYTRMDGGGFDNGVVVEDTTATFRIPEGRICSFKVTAANGGGESFDSEILSAGYVKGGRRALVVNSFNRVSGPAAWKAPAPADSLLAGFLDNVDHGVPYIEDISYTGSMKEFRRYVPWASDDDPGYGSSYGDHETEVIAGNSFDYPFVHGLSLMAAGCSFTSSSDESFASGRVSMDGYDVVDLVLGKEKTTAGRFGRKEFTVLPGPLRARLEEFADAGAALIVSGSYVVTDAPMSDGAVKWIGDVLGCRRAVSAASCMGKVVSAGGPHGLSVPELRYNNVLSPSVYIVEEPDGLAPASRHSHVALRYGENNIGAAVVNLGRYRTATFGFPLETIEDEGGRNLLFGEILKILIK